MKFENYLHNTKFKQKNIANIIDVTTGKYIVSS